MAGEIGHWCGIDFIGGGLGAVDKIDGAVLQDKEGFLIITPTVFAPFSLDADSGAGENSPQIIAPNTNPGNKRWVLTGGVFAGLTLYGNIVMPDGGTIGQAAGPLLTFDDTNNYLEITGCKVGIGVVPTHNLQILSTTDVGGVYVGGAVSNVGYVLNNTDTGGERWNILSTANASGFGGGLFAIAKDAGGTSPYLVINVTGKVGINDAVPASFLDVNGDVNTTDVYKVDDVQVVSSRVIDARCDDALNSGDATTDGVIDSLRDAMITHGLIAAA